MTAQPAGAQARVPSPRAARGGAGIRPLASAAGIAALLALAPLAALAWIAASGDASTLTHVAVNVLPDALRQTGVLLLGVGLLAGAIGVGAAWLVTAYSFPGRAVVSAALSLPLAVPTYIAAYVYVELLDPLGPVQTAVRALFGFRSRADYWFPEIRSMPGAIVVLSFVLYPYVYMTVRALFAMQSANLLEVGRTLGARPLELFRRVALPMARPALALGLSLALLETLNDVGATEYLGVRTLTVSIYTTWVNRGSLPGAAQIALVMLAVVAVVMTVEVRARGHRRFGASVKRPRPSAPLRLRGWRAAAALSVCAVPAALGFAVPAGFLAREAIARWSRRGFDAEFLSRLEATIALAALATLIVVLLGALTASAGRLWRTRRMSLLVRAASIGYAIPGTVLAVGYLWPLAAIDNAIANAARWAFGSSPGLLLTGSGAALVIAYAARFMGIAVGGLESGFARISTHIDDAARTLGRRPAQLLREIHAPLARPALFSAALLVFVDVMKELPASLLLRPLNMDTLATALYADAARGAFEDGALSALAIVAVGLAPVLAMIRLSGSQARPPEAVALEAEQE
ncbi:iron ABC transporter permease [Alsobacter soli]|uniref:Iron ABC transporter permease n=1 Tax=Alsobacter soli TaxID=2109933 RepID=A0A2T1HUV5_9HYPH|nr:iron ABC transporter permease [Alsobacter soli]PSC05424.1 iron ABC transporter permease [Alsobacter soli]